MHRSERSAASLAGPNGVELLVEQHRELAKLMARFDTAKRSKDKDRLFVEMASRLVAHEVIEREIFYPACEHVLGRSDPLVEGMVEHALAEYALHLAEQARGTDAFVYLVHVVEEILLHHVEEEEAEIFSVAARLLGEEHLEALGKAMRERYRSVLHDDYRRILEGRLAATLRGRRRARSSHEARLFAP